ncbi:MAG TPA: PQQ-dependent sugar dehydrogenase, partial [Roseiflexaceae bacterium]|nr:PQQ-dependent sugar dehydrogenase [Roseiflexaceae bacterium]
MHKYLPLTMGLLATLVLAACGGSTTSSTTSSTPAPAATAQPAAAATAETAPAATAAPSTEAAPAPTLAQPAPTQMPEAQTPQATTGDLASAKISLKLINDSVENPVYVTHGGDDSGRLFVVEKRGRIVTLRDGQLDATPFLDISDRVGSNGSEQGLLSVAFHPQFRENGRLFVNYTDRNGDTVISRFEANGDAADPASEAVLLQIDQPYGNHNGGLVLFGPDGYLYIGMGDGGSAGDPQGNGQDLQALLGKMLRLDVDGGEPYAIPADNPWPDGGDARPEVWAYGLRNPWRFSFDRATGDLLIADDDGGDGLLSRILVQVPEDIEVAVAVSTFPDVGFTGAG